MDDRSQERLATALARAKARRAVGADPGAPPKRDDPPPAMLPELLLTPAMRVKTPASVRPTTERKPSGNALELAAVCTDIGSYQILHGVDLVVPAGGITMLLGRNGAGKTTTLRTIMGLWPARSGSILHEGKELVGRPVDAIARAGIGYVPEGMAIFADLTVEENMALGARSGGLDRERLLWLQDAFPPLGRFWRQSAGNLSGGQKQMLAIARALVERRGLYLIDEPSKGLSPAIVAAMVEVFAEVRKEGSSILMVEQNFPVATALGDWCTVLEDGRSVWGGAMADFVARTDLQESLLGLKAGIG
jgi:branched-chain amino acid transport system ATP-binding protein